MKDKEINIFRLTFKVVITIFLGSLALMGCSPEKSKIKINQNSINNAFQIIESNTTNQKALTNAANLLIAAANKCTSEIRKINNGDLNIKVSVYCKKLNYTMQSLSNFELTPQIQFFNDKLSLNYMNNKNASPSDKISVASQIINSNTKNINVIKAATQLIIKEDKICLQDKKDKLKYCDGLIINVIPSFSVANIKEARPAKKYFLTHFYPK